MTKLYEVYRLEDRAVPSLCLTGMPIVGTALTSPFFLPYEVPAQISITELMKTMGRNREGLIRRVERMAQTETIALQEGIWKKTLKEVEQGTMAGLYSPEEIERIVGRHYNVVPSFGLQQGEGSD